MAAGTASRRSISVAVPITSPAGERHGRRRPEGERSHGDPVAAG
jgi:hypothetical protein